jgi:hypothetical protein
MTPFKKFCLHTGADKKYKHPDFQRDFESVYEHAVNVECKDYFNTKAQVEKYVLDSMVQSFNDGSFHKGLLPHWMACLQKQCSWAGALGMYCR